MVFNQHRLGSEIDLRDLSLLPGSDMDVILFNALARQRYGPLLAGKILRPKNTKFSILKYLKKQFLLKRSIIARRKERNFFQRRYKVYRWKGQKKGTACFSGPLGTYQFRRRRISMTRSGHRCQRWDESYPHVTKEKFVLNTNRNKCRLQSVTHIICV